ncbi:MAG: hypothetical protein K9W44_10440 [Candidatus Lokiarchaeota archaeon]|nr:hypothetical protein [Candidatus Harpocratesius repetitus]
MEEKFPIEKIRELLKNGMPLNEIMSRVMKIGAEIVENFGHKDYSSPMELFKEIQDGTSPLNKIEGQLSPVIQDQKTNVFAVKVCPMKKIMQEMSKGDEYDQNVNSVLDDFHLRENETSGNYSDIGCYIQQQIRQMLISSFTLNGKYDFNLIHLGCDKGKGRNISEGDVEAIKMDREMLSKLLDENDCVYAISVKEGQ